MSTAHKQPQKELITAEPPEDIQALLEPTVDLSIAMEKTAVLVLDPQKLQRQSKHCVNYSFRTYAGRTFSRFPLYQSLTLFEDDEPLPHRQALHDEIRELGMGRYSLWQDVIYFSSSDGSDPLTNGKKYHLQVPAYVRFLEGLRSEAVDMYGV